MPEDRDEQTIHTKLAAIEANLTQEMQRVGSCVNLINDALLGTLEGKPGVFERQNKLADHLDDLSKTFQTCQALHHKQMTEIHDKLNEIHAWRWKQQGVIAAMGAIVALVGKEGLWRIMGK